MLNIYKIPVLLVLVLLSLSLQAQSPESITVKKQKVPATAEAIKPLKQGSKIPEVNFTTAEGAYFSLNSFVKEQPTVLIFYRGGWCPYCNMHLQELIEADPQLRALGYQILAVSPDRPQMLAASKEKHNMTYTLLSDTSMAAAQAFGVAFKVADTTVNKYKEYGINLEEASGGTHHLLPVPSVFIIDKKGVVRYVYFNPDYKIRLSAAELVREAKKAL